YLTYCFPRAASFEGHIAVAGTKREFQSCGPVDTAVVKFLIAIQLPHRHGRRQHFLKAAAVALLESGPADQ
ncbi:MAG TPA: hypothetical protein VHN36_07440, partial [Ilumatobacteraceae bacterium]|nr:hypothetical protein [Ilumatobacteraceae bacterium]